MVQCSIIKFFLNLKDVRKEGKFTHYCNLYMAVPYHEQMHTAVWTWIREYSNSPTEAMMFVNPSAIIILTEIISRIPNEHPPFHPDACVPSYLGPTGTIPIMGSFSEQMCTVADHLRRTGQQQMISWYDMKRILQYYVSDAKEYIEHINSLGWNNHQLNSYFDLNLNDLNFPPLNHPTIVNQLLWSRYLTGTRIYHPTENPQHSGERFVIELLARGEEYWGPRVSEDIFGIQEHVRFFYNPGEQEGDEETSKKKEALKKIQAIVDEVSDDIGDGGYLKLMNVMKELWQS